MRSMRSLHLPVPALLVAMTASLAACADARTPTAAQAPEGTPAATAEGDVVALAVDLPVVQSGSTSSPTPLFRLTQTGTGPSGQFLISNTSSPTTSAALTAATNGGGPALRAISTGKFQAGSFQISNGTNASSALYALTNGTGRGAFFQVSNGDNTSPALSVTHNGRGSGIHATLTGAYGALSHAGRFEITNSSNGAAALSATTQGNWLAGNFQIFNKESQANALHVTTVGRGHAAEIGISNTSNTASALSARTNGTGWAGAFYGPKKGVRISTDAGGTGLQVAGGTKQAVVATPSGARSLYTEESSEVWFTDYGFGKLADGRARVLLDPAFAQTVAVDEPYHVFVQPYGRAELYVAERTSLGFVVALKDGDPGVEFGYRVVAKRLGYERARLEPAPWADGIAAVTPIER